MLKVLDGITLFTKNVPGWHIFHAVAYWRPVKRSHNVG